MTQAIQPNYENEETREVIDEELEKQRERKRERSVETDASPRELSEAERDVGSEEQPGSDYPQPEVTVVPWRGDDVEWLELGDTLVKAAELEEQDDISDVQMMKFVYKTFAEKSVPSELDEAYWRGFDLRRADDTDGLMDLFDRLVDESDSVDEEAREKAEQFRQERSGDRET